MSTTALADRSASGFLPERIVHLHPTLRCNLACSHCYSGASPLQGAGLPAELWRRALPRLKAEGYTQISLSGGEPLVYPGLAELVAVAKGEGLRVTMVSNGLLATARHDTLLDRLDGIAISFDGLAARHNAVRGRDDAFARASAAVARLAQRGRPVAAAISVGRDGLEELPDLADHLVQLGARALQIRPVAAAGRAQGLGDAALCQGNDALRLYLVVLALQQELHAQVLVHGDLAPARQLWRQREAYASLLAQCGLPGAGRPSLSDLVNPLVVTEQGICKPVAYDFHPHFSIGHLDRLDEAWLARYARVGVSALRRLVGSSLASLAEHPGVVDWFDLLARASTQQPVAGYRVVPVQPIARPVVHPLVPHTPLSGALPQLQAGLLRSAA